MKKRPGRKKSAEQRYWAKEAEIFRRKQPKIFKESRARERIAKLLIKPLSLWRTHLKKSAEKWNALESYLLSKNFDPKKLVKILTAAQESSKETLKLERAFLTMRATASRLVLKESDWGAVQRILVMKDKVAAIEAEKHFYGILQELGDAKRVSKFGELVVRLKLSKDKGYARLREKVALAGIGVKNNRKIVENRVGELTEHYMFGKIDGNTYFRENLLLDYVLASQYFNLTEAGEYLYVYMEKTAKDRKLKSLLKTLGKEMNRRKKMHAKDKRAIEIEFKESPEL